MLGRGEPGWCSDMTSNHGVWRHTGDQFPLPGVVLTTTSLLLCDNLCLLYEIGLLMSRQKFIIASLAKYASCAFSGLFFFAWRASLWNMHNTCEEIAYCALPDRRMAMHFSIFVIVKSVTIDICLRSRIILS